METIAIANAKDMQAFVNAHPMCVVDIYEKWAGPNLKTMRDLTRLFSDKNIGFAGVNFDAMDDLPECIAEVQDPCLLSFFKNGKLVSQTHVFKPFRADVWLQNLLEGAA